MTVTIRNDDVVEQQFEYFFMNLRTSDRAVILNPVTATVTIEDDNDSELTPQF